jgi:hypothetical protein
MTEFSTIPSSLGSRFAAYHLPGKEQPSPTSLLQIEVQSRGCGEATEVLFLSAWPCALLPTN